MTKLTEAAAKRIIRKADSYIRVAVTGEVAGASCLVWVGLDGSVEIGDNGKRKPLNKTTLIKIAERLSAAA